MDRLFPWYFDGTGMRLKTLWLTLTCAFGNAIGLVVYTAAIGLTLKVIFGW